MPRRLVENLRARGVPEFSPDPVTGDKTGILQGTKVLGDRLPADRQRLGKRRGRGCRSCHSAEDLPASGFTER
jgi:hypothetical protein